MNQTWKVRVVDATRKPFKYHAMFIWGGSGRPRATAPVPADLYAEGDLAVYLEDCGAEVKDILTLLQTLESAPGGGEIPVTPPDELLEVLWAR
jgi:hypothetical protein